MTLVLVGEIVDATAVAAAVATASFALGVTIRSVASDSIVASDPLRHL